MIFKQLYSGSKGNAYILTADNGKRLLIDPGVTWKQLMTALDFNLKGIVGCILSHEHKDHSKSVEDVLLSGIDVYASLRTLDTLGILDNRRAYPFSEEPLLLDGFKIFDFDVNHDAVEPKGFRIECDGKDFLFATDTGYIEWKFKRRGKLIQFDTIAIECNCCEDILQYKVDKGEINEELAKRIVKNHMSVQECKRYLTEDCDLSQLQDLHLIHISSTNNDTEKVKERFFNQFFVKTIICGD